MAATIKDVANAAGFSIATVSHVINNTRRVSDETRALVEKAIADLGFVANINARGLRSSVSHRIGLLVPEVSDYFPIDIMAPIESVLLKEGYQIIIGYTRENLELERRQIEFFTYQQIDGLLLFPAIGDHSYLEKMNLDYPVVLMDRRANGLDADCVLAEDETAVYGAVSELIKAGHTTIGMVTGAPGISTTRERSLGYERALAENGLKISPSLIECGNSTYEGGLAATERLLRSGGMTALFVSNIAMTIGALKCLIQNNIRIPEEMALLGWGDSKWTELTNPPLSVLSHPNQAIGKKAAQILLKRIRKPKAPFRDYLLPVELVRRKSF